MKKSLMNKIEFFKHNINNTDIKRVNNILRSIFLTTGEAVKQFEERFSSYTGSQYTIGVTSCTAALHLSLIAAQIRPGDEVITTPMSF
ncbi:MAG: DegT/DnrJ/EryC1/StrS family aminotransferase, partial [Candidatus Omnitrophica bacterium]|nr:DegT/DnrJ/EryC1/StrS family aminotransferase [Candidatus Omnitrophota bacterium]